MSAKNDNMIRKLIDAVSGLSEPKTTGYDTAAEVRRVEGNIVWVHIPGGVDETPVSRTIDAKPGDTVQVRVSGGTAFLVGNGSAPPTDDTMAISARNTANTAQIAAESAQEDAEMARTVAAGANRLAEGTNEHFWHDNTGAHITEDTQEDYQTDPANAGGNTLITSQGMAVRRGQTELAVFSASGAQVGQSGAAHSVIDANGQRFYADDGTTQLANIGYGEGAAESGTAVAPYYTLGVRSGNTVGNYSLASGNQVTASGQSSHAEGSHSIASGQVSHAEGGYATASGMYAHAEGYHTTASGGRSHAEGEYAVSNAQNTHSEGYHTTAHGKMSHAEGNYSVANGAYSHAAGYYTIASRASQTVIGQCNEEDTGGTSSTTKGDYAFIIGNGYVNFPETASETISRSNALTVDWDGNVNAAGTLIGDSGNYLTEQKSFTNTSERVSLSSSTTDKTVLSVTAPKTGYVIVSGFVTMTTNNSGNRHITIDVEGTKFYNDTRPAHSTNNGQMGCCCIAPCTAGDTIAIQAWQTSGSTLYAGGRIDAVFL